MGGAQGREGSQVHAYSAEYGDVFLSEGVGGDAGLGV